MRSISYMLRRIREEPRPVRFVASRLLAKSGLSSALTIRRNGYRLRFHPAALSTVVWVDPGYTRDEEHFVGGMLVPGDTYVDVGANVGLLALRAAAVVGPSGSVVAVEPNPRTYGYLQSNIALNPHLSVIPVLSAVGAERGELRMSDTENDDQNAVLTGDGGIVVPVQPLDDILRVHRAAGEIALLKIDVEGFELPVLKGATETLQRTRCVVLESWDHHFARYEYTSADVLNYLRSSGFGDIHLVTAEGTVGDAVSARHRSSRCENLVAMRSH